MFIGGGQVLMFFFCMEIYTLLNLDFFDILISPSLFYVKLQKK